MRAEDHTVRGGLRHLPPIQRLLETAAARELIAATSHTAVVAALRLVLDALRAELTDEAADPVAAIPADSVLIARAAAILAAAERPRLRPVINATGIVLHTNLGRAPLPEAAAEAVASIARGYCNLEFELGGGRRGRRGHAVELRLAELTGAEAALVVNNNAAAVLLALSGLAAGGEVIVSRGELVEIGGGFRIPDVIRAGGARLVEVGTTNRTRIADYRDAIGPQTRAILHVHQSNFRIVGFTAAPARAELAALAAECGVPLVEDLGSGTLVDLGRFGLPHEPRVQDAVAAGAEIVAFSGDKLLGGPQAGILVGRRAAIDRLRQHPLLRAVRIDKLSLAALDAVLRLHEQDAHAALPVLRMLGQGEAVLQDRAERLGAMLPEPVLYRIDAVDAHAGGGALPGAAIPSRALAMVVEDMPAEQLARRLREGHPAVVGRIVDDLLTLDMLTVADTELQDLAEAIRAAVG